MTVVMRGGVLNSNNQSTANAPQEGSTSPSSSAAGQPDPLIVNNTTTPLVTSSTSVFTGVGLVGFNDRFRQLDGSLTTVPGQQQPTQQWPSINSSPASEANKNQPLQQPIVELTANGPDTDILSTTAAQGDGLVAVDQGSEGVATPDTEFPIAELQRLDDMINRPRWVIPVLPKGELEVLLDASIDLCKRGLDTRSEACQRFFNGGLNVSFMKILTDEAVSGWKLEIHVSIC